MLCKKKKKLKASETQTRSWKECQSNHNPDHTGKVFKNRNQIYLVLKIMQICPPGCSIGHMNRNLIGMFKVAHWEMHFTLQTAMIGDTMYYAKLAALYTSATAVRIPCAQFHRVLGILTPFSCEGRSPVKS